MVYLRVREGEEPEPEGVGDRESTQVNLLTHLDARRARR